MEWKRFKYYFGKSVNELTLSECAVLAGITKNPTFLNPVDYPEDNDARRKLILKKMYQFNYISDTEYQSALEDKVYARIANKTAQGRKNSVYSYFTDAVITKVVSDLQEQKGYTQSQAYQLVLSWRTSYLFHSKYQAAKDCGFCN